MPSGPGVIADELIRQIARAVPPPVATFLLTSETTAAGVIAHYRRTHTTTIQLVDTLPEAAYADIRRALPQVRLVQVVHVTGVDALPVARRAAAYADALLLDSGNPALPVPELGGTGRTHDWELSRRIVAESLVPVFLAGGLNPGNVAGAIRRVRPFGIDVCSGVRTGGRLDGGKLRGMVAAALRATPPSEHPPHPRQHQ